jgi:hypothetical protein
MNQEKTRFDVAVVPASVDSDADGELHDPSREMATELTSRFGKLQFDRTVN